MVCPLVELFKGAAEEFSMKKEFPLPSHKMAATVNFCFLMWKNKFI
jgi:hypothetical protein